MKIGREINFQSWTFSDSFFLKCQPLCHSAMLIKSFLQHSQSQCSGGEEVMRVMEPQMAPIHLVIGYHSRRCSFGDICKSKLFVMMTEMVMISCDSPLTLLVNLCLWGWSTDWRPQSDPSCIMSCGDNDGDIYHGGELMISNQGLWVCP